MPNRTARGAGASSAPRLFACAALMLLALLAQPRAVVAQQPWTAPDASNNISNTNTGNVGVGTSAPQGRLGVVGATSSLAMSLFSPGLGAGEPVPLLLFNAPGSSGGAAWNVARVRAGTNGVDSSGSFLSIDPINTNGAGWAAGLTVRAGGSVGVGTTSPNGLLDVAGAAAHVWVGRSAAALPDANPNPRLLVGDATAVNPGILTLASNDTVTGDAVGVVSFANYGSGAADKRVAAIAGLLDGGAGGGALIFSTFNGGVFGEAVRITRAGSVGIGTVSPAARLTVAGSGVFNSAGAASILITNTAANSGFIQNVTDTNVWQIADAAGATKIAAMAGASGDINFYQGAGRVVFNGTGNVGIGTPNPQKALDVNGDINVSGNINAKFQDVAEWVPAAKLLPAGTVVVLDPSHSNRVTSSSKAYDTRVAGVVSPRPGISLGERGEGKALVATTGRVRVKVDATRAPIAVGDLLVTSDIEGVAMKSVPVELGGVAIHRPGTIIGKALEPLEKGTGEILVLLSLQ